MGNSWARLGLGIAGFAIAGPIGFMAGSYLGSRLFPEDFESEMPPVHDYSIQSSSVGTPIPIVHGTVKLAGNVIWVGKLESYCIEHKAEGGKGGGDEQVSYERQYKRSFLIAICEGPATVLRMWQGKKLRYADSTFDFEGYGPEYNPDGIIGSAIGSILGKAAPPVTFFNGDNNSGIGTLIGENYSEYSNLCLAYFENWELGNAGSLPNFVFEVSSSGDMETKTVFMGGVESGGNHLWKIKDTGNALSLLDSYTLSGNVIDIKYLSTTDRLLIAIGTKVYCYNPSTITLDTTWGTNGYVETSGVIYRIEVDGSGFCAIVHNIALTYRVMLLNASGSIVWRIAGSYKAYCIGFDATGNILVGHSATASGRIIRYSRVDGGYIQQVRAAGGISGFWMNTVFGHPSDATQVYGDKGYTGSYFECIDTDGANDWTHNNASGERTYDGCHMLSGDKVIWLGDSVHIADALTGANLLSGGTSDMSRIDISSINEIYAAQNGGILHVYNASIVEQRSLDLSLGDIHGCAIREVSFVGSDINFASIIKDLLTNERYGGYDEGDLITEDFDSIITYCDDNNLKGSLAITKQRPLSDWIAYICSHFQGYFYEIGGKVGLNCFRDQASVLSITQNDLIRDGDEPPVQITKRSYETTFNRLEGTWTDRSNDYKTSVVPSFDRIDQRESGQVRTKIIDLKAITDDELASKMTWRIFIDEFYRFSQYSFKIGYKSMLLEVGDVIDVTDGHLLTAQKMRVMSIGEEKDGRKAVISAVEDIAALYPDLDYSIQQSEEFGNQVISLTDGTIIFRESWNENKLNMSIIPGGAETNGWYIYMSYDDASYSLIGRAVISGITGGSANSTGTIQSNLPAHTAVIHRAGEWFDVSIGTLTDLDTAISDDDFFNNRKLAKVGNEIIAYKTCVESSVEGTWQVSNLIRGLFGTEPVAHVSGETFSTLDIGFVYKLKESDIGKTLYFKIVSFYADEIQLVSEVPSQSYVVSGLYRKPLPVSLMRINGREGLSTYKTVDVTLDWYFCSRQSGFGRGGYGNALWGSYTKDPLLERLKVELEEEDGTPITNSNYELDAYGEPAQLEILEADRDGKNPIVVKLSPMSNLISDSRQITIEKI